MMSYNVEAEVHMQLKNGAYRVKVKILNEEIGMYINGNRVLPPNEKYPDWSVLTPKVFGANIVEFNGKSPLWKEYKQACIEAVQEHIRHEKLDLSDDMDQLDELSKEEFNKKMLEDLDKIGF